MDKRFQTALNKATNRAISETQALVSEAFDDKFGRPEYDLDLCPWCGGPADFEHLENGRWSIGCNDGEGECLGFQLMTSFATKREAQQAWNTRRQALAPEPAGEDFQSKVQPWLMACFGEMIAGDREERNHRFLEEALELVQSLECTASEAHQLVDYVYGRPAGHPPQEVGGTMVTLAALCLANDLDMHAAGWVELNRIWGKVEQIRAKQAAKPKHGPLPADALATSHTSGLLRASEIGRQAIEQIHALEPAPADMRSVRKVDRKDALAVVERLLAAIRAEAAKP